MDSRPISLGLSPIGQLFLYSDVDNQETALSLVADKVAGFFEEDYSAGLLRLGLANFTMPLAPSLSYWQRFAQIFLTEICKLSTHDQKDIVLPRIELDGLLKRAPFMRGAELLDIEMLAAIWRDLARSFFRELEHFGNNLQAYFQAHNSTWNMVGRVCFHLAENKNNHDKPFAFLATYSTRLLSTSSLQHLPLGRALQEYVGEQNRSQLLALLMPVQKAAEQSGFIKSLVDNGSIFKPLAFGASEAHQFLKAIPIFEAAGLIVRVPNWWNPKKPPRPQIKIALGKTQTNTMGLDALLDFDMEFALGDGEKITLVEMQNLLSAPDQLIQIKGQWIEVDKGRLTQVLSHWQEVAKRAKNEGLSFAEGLRLLANAPNQKVEDNLLEEIVDWSNIVEGPWLKETLSCLRNPQQLHDDTHKTILRNHLNASLRPYQELGVNWLWLLYSLRLGGCLADDMGLGKTIQVLAFLLLVKHCSVSHRPHLLVLPASLLDNWQAEIGRFTPNLNIIVAHSSAQKEASLKSLPTLVNVDLVLTTYSYVHRLSWLSEVDWDSVILDEAQCIKNPSTLQARSLRALKSQRRFALTGTPIENRLMDLWSLFNFVAPGLLGSSKAFSDYGKKAERFNSSVRQLVSPYILRRLKSDKKIINDLPDKTELQAYCTLSKQQVLLYQQAVAALESKLEEEVDGIKRRGVVLSYLMRFKQICNHPDQWLGHGQFTAESSGKFMRLKELTEAIFAKQERVLVFTQFREIIPALSEFLANIFERPGLVLHGQTPIKDRAKFVDAFQQDNGPPFFILSLKAGGTGLNLTHAAHVIHFDRWWNPAVENQATDRAYRIGQKKNVLVHKLICRGTVEEKIDEMINAKKSLANDVLTNSGEALLTELSNDELLKVVALDIHRALNDGEEF